MGIVEGYANIVVNTQITEEESSEFSQWLLLSLLLVLFVAKVCHNATNLIKGENKSKFYGTHWINCYL